MIASMRRTRVIGLTVATLGAAGVTYCLPRGVSWHGAVLTRTVTEDVNLRAELEASLTAVATTWIEEHPPETLEWDWGEGVLAFGLERAFRLTGESRYRSYLRSYFHHHAASGVRVMWSDDTTPALAAAERVLDGDDDFRPLVDRVVDYSMSSPRSPSRGMLLHLGNAPLPGVRRLLPDAWVDSVFHVVPTLMRQSKVTGDPRYRDAGARQLALFLSALQDPQTGLCTHAYNDRGSGEPVPPFESSAFWARGNGWMLATLVDALAHLPPTHPAYGRILDGARRLESALRPLQTKDGLFHTLLLREDTYQEVAGSALILYAMARGMRLEVFPEETREAVLRGGRALLWALRRSGVGRAVVTGTSLGTNPIAATYAITPTADGVSYGVGAWLMAASEIATAMTL